MYSRGQCRNQAFRSHSGLLPHLRSPFFFVYLFVLYGWGGVHNRQCSVLNSWFCSQDCCGAGIKLGQPQAEQTPSPLFYLLLLCFVTDLFPIKRDWSKRVVPCAHSLNGLKIAFFKSREKEAMWLLFQVNSIQKEIAIF